MTQFHCRKRELYPPCQGSLHVSTVLCPCQLRDAPHIPRHPAASHPSQQAGIPTSPHPQSISSQGLLCQSPPYLPLIATGKPCQALPGAGTSFSPAQTRHGAWGWHTASPQDRVLPASSCGEARCQLWAMRHVTFFRGEIKSFWQQAPPWQQAPCPSCVGADGGRAGAQPAPQGPHGPSPICPAQLLSPLVTLGVIFQVPLTWVKQMHQRANCVFQH